jgi:hypothetical protein
MESINGKASREEERKLLQALKFEAINTRMVTL